MDMMNGLLAAKRAVYTGLFFLAASLLSPVGDASAQNLDLDSFLAPVQGAARLSRVTSKSGKPYMRKPCRMA